jgi:hypothetical protein
VCDHETSKNEEAKSLLPGCENTTAMGCNARKTNKQEIFFINLLAPEFDI